MKEKLSQYFNKATLYGIVPISSTALAGLLCYWAATSGSPLTIASAVILTAFAVGDINGWQQKATGKPIWEPRLPIFGI